MDFEMKETGAEPGYHVSAGIYRALAKEKGMQRCANCNLILCTLLVLPSIQLSWQE